MTKVKSLKNVLSGGSGALLEIKKPRSNVVKVIVVESLQNGIPTIKLESKDRSCIREWIEVVVGCLESGSNLAKELNKSFNQGINKINRIDINFSNLFTVSADNNSTSQKVYEEFLERFYELDMNN